MRLLPFHHYRWYLPLLFAFHLGWPVTSYAAPANRPIQFVAAAPSAIELARPPAAAMNLEEAAQAVVRIAAVGTFADPKEGAQTLAGQGSGFIINPNGIAVTNNHVVTGAAYLKVYLPGDEEPRSAKVLGVDECADLAVIDIAGDDLPYLDWSTQLPKVGAPIYAAGYPLGDPEYTLTSGIISKARTNGQTSWASLAYVLQHDAALNPGSSGGALLDGAGRVLGINYASNDNANQYFAISRELARPIIEQLRKGMNLDTIGVNGEAMSDGKTFAGVWVYSVRSGSPADQTGIQPGDFIVEMENVQVGIGATLETYCDILRGHRPQDVVAIKLLRNQGELWAGQLNGRPLSRVATPTPTPAAATATAPPVTSIAPTPTPTAAAATATAPPPMNPALESAVRLAGWDPANGALEILDGNIITATVEIDADWAYPLAVDVKEYALYYNVALGTNGDVCYADLGEASPKPSYSHRVPSFQLIRQGAVGRFTLLGWDWSDDKAGRGEELISKTSPLIHTGKDQLNEVVITIRGEIITAYINGSQVVQYTGMALLESGTLQLRAYRTTTGTTGPACVFRDVQLYMPN